MLYMEHCGIENLVRFLPLLEDVSTLETRQIIGILGTKQDHQNQNAEKLDKIHQFYLINFEP